MKAKFADLVTYMESLATHHKGILNRDDEKHFFRFELEEMLTGMKSNMNYPALVMEGYDFNFVDENSDNLQKRVSCAFMLLGKVSDKGITMPSIRCGIPWKRSEMRLWSGSFPINAIAKPTASRISTHARSPERPLRI
ncbi:MAG: hypothetical protein WC699_15920 [Bacteroidales bacterium]|jgi:hypothetical protein